MFDLAAIIQFFKKNFSLKDIVIILCLIALFFATRLINLDKWPIFSDEGIYIHWAKVAKYDASLRFISLTDGRQPLQTWGTIPFLKLFPENALLAGRMFSVATGFVALIGMFSLLYYLVGKRSAYLGTFIYIVTPYFLFYDRMALVDSGINAGFTWMLLFSILLARTLRLDIALLFGLIAGFTLLAKSSARLFLGLSAFAPILFFDKRWKSFSLKSINYYFLLGISVFLAFLIYNVQRLSPFLHFVELKNTTFILTTAELIQNPFAVFFSNIRSIPLYVFWELGWILVVFAFLGLAKMYKKDWKMFIYFALWLLIPYIALSFIGRVVFPRYLIFLGNLLFVLAIYYFSTVKNHKKLYAMVGSTLLVLFYFDYPILFKPAALNFPRIDRGQYVEGRSAVWGAQEVVEFARSKVQPDKPVVLLAEGNFGLVGDVLDVFVRPDEKIYVRGIWPLNKNDLLLAQPDLKDKSVYIVFSHRTEFPAEWPMRLVKQYPKPNGSPDVLYLYELLPTTEQPVIEKK